ncbi:hypothetical protein CHS0354_028120 [Potamilus streckersoni]|uniref:Disease resistance R13L4/SHOC-2-like LRR domain-containing protein n=2 Tax=Potamilus streckersoni TaxID=2493646 RepID=A0AAE0WEK6_9BIVA|nr:hypothetical protein CHS0354_028120 [Potamilus streckersoni]
MIVASWFVKTYASLERKHMKNNISSPLGENNLSSGLVMPAIVNQCSDSKADSDKIYSTASADYSSQSLTVLPAELLLSHSISQLYLDYNDIVLLPENFWSCFPLLELFSAIGNNLISLPDEFEKVPNLSKVYLNENKLESLPDSICKLRHLKCLKLTGNLLVTLPKEFGEISALETLCLEENKLTKLPGTLGLLGSLQHLELESNNISELPLGIGRLLSLEVLNLSNNKLDELPDTFGDMPRLKIVELSSNHIEFLPSNFESVQTLQKLYLDNNVLRTLPDWLSDCKQLVEISVRDNQLHDQPLTEKFGQVCQKLKILNLAGNFISKLPDSLGELCDLEYLHLGSVIGELEGGHFQNGNWLTSLPESVCNLDKLQRLHLDENQLYELPTSFGKLTALDTLDLGQNVLHELPDSFSDLRSLRICLLSKNHIRLLPGNFGNLSNLEELRLDDNEIAELPESIGKLSKLKSLDLYHNKLTEIPPQLNQLKNLIRLDLDANCFKIPWDKVPQIIPKAKYPPRDPNLKDNWRGRPRQDITDMENDIIRIETSEDANYERPEPDLNISEDVLWSAIRSNLSLWKSHSDTSKTRRDYTQNNHNPSLASYEDGLSEEEKEDCDNNSDIDEEDDEFVPPILVKKRFTFESLTENSIHMGSKSGSETDSSSDTAAVQISTIISPSEDWDSEIQEVCSQYNSYRIPAYHHPQSAYDQNSADSQFNFIPSDIHEYPYRKQPKAYPIEEGQFDD